MLTLPELEDQGENTMNILKQPDAALLVNSQLDRLTELIMQKGGVYEQHGSNKYTVTKYRQDTVYNLQYLAESLQLGSLELWENYVHWLKQLLGPLNLSMPALAEHFQIMGDVLSAEFDAETSSCVRYLCTQASGIVLSNNFVAPTEPFPESDFGTHAKHYQELLLTSQKHRAINYIDELLESGVPVRNIYLDVLQRVQREIGSLWHLNKISVAQEHYCTGITQLIIARLYPRLFNQQIHKFKMVSTCVSGELHELGLRMVTDIMEMDGWDTCYLGANMPNSVILKTIAEKQADLVAISVTFPLNLHKAEELITSIRQDARLAGVKILVGGYPFIQDASLWQKIGADSFAPDARIAGRIATSMVENA